MNQTTYTQNEKGKLKTDDNLKSQFESIISEEKKRNMDFNAEKNSNETEKQKTEEDSTEKTEKDNKTKTQSTEGKKDPEIKPTIVNKFFSGFKSLWKRTFPGEEDIEKKMEARKQEALLLKLKVQEFTEEEIKEIEERTPEWKRNAVVLLVTEEVAEKQSIMDIARQKLLIHAKNLKIYKEAKKSYSNSEVEKLVQDLKTSYTNVKGNITDSQNPFLVVSRDLIDKVTFVSSSSLAIQTMRKYDPSFDIIEFEKEVDIIFKQLIIAFILDDVDTIEKLAGEQALAVLTSEIKSRKERGIENKYKELMYVEQSMFDSASIVDNDNCIIRLKINTQEINCKVSKKDGSVVEGELGLVENVQYLIDVTRHPNPIVEEVGHHYLIVGVTKIGVVKQLV